MSNVFFCSDTHFQHNKDFLYEPRGFTSIQEHDEIIIANWNSLIQEKDIVYHLGDLVMTTNVDIVKKLNGQINLIIGNHDTENKIKQYSLLPNIKTISFGERIKYSKKMSFFLSHYPSITKNPRDKVLTWNLCGHRHVNDKFFDMENGIASYHCELDAHNNFPIALEDIVKDIHLWKIKNGE